MGQSPGHAAAYGLLEKFGPRVAKGAAALRERLAKEAPSKL